MTRRGKTAAVYLERGRYATATRSRYRQAQPDA